MNNITFKSIIPYLTALAVFVFLSIIYFSPVFKGKEIKQADIINHLGMSKEISDFRKVNPDVEPLWTNSMFGGMPAYQISVLYPSNLVSKINTFLTLGLPYPVAFLFLNLLGFYILLLCLKIDPWLSLVGAVAFGFSSYFFIIIEAGHNAKAHAMAFMAPVLAGVILTFRGRYILGGSLTALFVALELYANHLQITYYLILLLLIYGLFELIKIVKEGQYIHLLKVSGVFILALVLAVASNTTSLFATYDYGKSTTRGKTELTINTDGSSNAGNVTSGLDKDYATQWSYGIGETMTFLVPNYKGGASGRISQGESKSTLKKVDPQFRQNIGQMDQYWGDQPFTSGPFYMGAGIMFLFIIGLFFVKGNLKWALLIGTIFSITLGWGKNYMVLTEFFLDHFPGYNKFRAVSMILVIAELTIPLLAILGVNKLLDRSIDFSELVKIPLLDKKIPRKYFVLISFALTGGLVFLMYLLPDTFNTFFKVGEYDEIYSQIAPGNTAETAQSFLSNLEVARIQIFKSDAIRSFFIIAIIFLLIWFYIRSTINKSLLISALLLVTIVDLWNVNKRYLNDDNFVKKAEAQNPFELTAASDFILKDKDPDYRVLNISVSTFNDASTSYFHKSIGGYHGAKLKRYQELIDFHISSNIQNVINTLKANPSDSSINTTLANQGVLNMLNTRYLIYNAQAEPLKNSFAFGNAWFVKDYKLVKNADEEILALGKTDLLKTAIVDERFKDELAGFRDSFDSTSKIELANYQANHLTYKSKSKIDNLAVFSEIYFSNGWNAYIDGKLMPHFRANYVLRAMKIPAGEHKIEFKFEPKLYSWGEKISLISSLILIFSLLFALAIEVKNKIKTT